MSMIEFDDWILAVNVEEQEKLVGPIQRVMVDSGAAVSVCPLGYAPEIPMTNHSRRATLRTVEYENSDGGSVNVGFEVADVTRPLVAVGELQKRGMTVVMGPHASFVTRGHVTKPPGSKSGFLERSKGAYWLCLTRGENGTSTVVPIDLGDAVPTLENLSDLPTVEDTIDVAREDAEANVPLAVPSPKEPGAAERARHELMHMPYRSWCFSCVAGRGADDAHRKSDGYTGPPRVECDFMFLSSRVHLVNPGLTIFNMMDRESQSMAAALTVKAASETLVRFFLAMLDAWDDQTSRFCCDLIRR